MLTLQGLLERLRANRLVTLENHLGDERILLHANDQDRTDVLLLERHAHLAEGAQGVDAIPLRLQVDAFDAASGPRLEYHPDYIRVGFGAFDPNLGQGFPLAGRLGRSEGWEQAKDDDECTTKGHGASVPERQ